MPSTPEPRLLEFATDTLDLDPVFAAMRRESPVTYALVKGEPVWVVTGYHEARVVLSDPRFSRSRAVGRNPAGAKREERHLIDLDPPEHSRLRGLLTRWFTTRRIGTLRPRAEAIAADLLDTMAMLPQPVDLVHSLSLPMPITVICEMLGVPPRDRDEFTYWAEGFISISRLSPSQAAEARNGIETYLVNMIDERRANPSDDLLGELVRASDEDGTISQDELVALATGVLVGGFETSATMITNFTYTLLTQDLWTRLGERRDELPRAIEELLRTVPLGGGAHLGLPRVTTEEVQLGCQRIPEGAVVFASRSASSRDPEVYPRPDDITLDRDEPMPHLAFGHGIHHCIGAALARMELQVAIGGLIDRFPGLRLGIEPDELPWKKGLLVAGPRHLPVICAEKTSTD